MKGKLKYKQELKGSKEKEMPLQYDSFIYEGKRKKCKEMNPDWQVYTCRNV